MPSSPKPRPDGLTCIGCKHFYLDTGEPGWSEYTPGSDFWMECRKNVWRYKSYEDASEYRRCILSAQNCKHYELNTDLLK